MDPKEQVRLNRLRRVLDRRGMKLRGSRRKDPGAIGYGCYEILNSRGAVVAGKGFTLDMDAIEEWIRAYDEGRRP